MFVFDEPTTLDFNCENIPLLQYKGLLITMEKIDHNGKDDSYTFYAVFKDSKTALGQIYPSMHHYSMSRNRIYNALFYSKTRTFSVDNRTYDNVKDYITYMLREPTIYAKTRFSCARLVCNLNIREGLSIKRGNDKAKELAMIISETIQRISYILHRKYYEKETYDYIREHHKSFLNSADLTD